ncbi:MAG: 30S ribosomal protein S17e [Desulfurococcaceae archaeon]
MGKVRTKLVKRIARELLDKYPGLFKRDFNHNKLVVSKLTTTSSKKLRNQIAGYITHLLAVSAKKEKHVELPEATSETSA